MTACKLHFHLPRLFSYNILYTVFLFVCVFCFRETSLSFSLSLSLSPHIYIAFLTMEFCPPVYTLHWGFLTPLRKLFFYTEINPKGTVKLCAEGPQRVLVNDSTDAGRLKITFIFSPLFSNVLQTQTHTREYNYGFPQKPEFFPRRN